MNRLYRVSRRVFLTEVSRSVFAIAILGTGVVACSSTSGEETSTTSVTPNTGTDPTTTTTEPSRTAATETTGAPNGITVQRVNLGNVSAYVVVRGGEAAIVDTGNPGDVGDIEAGLSEIGLGWSDVGNVILTHKHPDHIGSLGPVMDAAAEANGYAGADDIPSISAPRSLTAIGDGDTVFGLSIIETPGHTPGSISVLDPVAKVLVVGDAMNGADGGVAAANPRFSEDMTAADDSVKKLAALDFDSVYFGHGEPVVGGASQLVAELAASL